MGLIIKVAQLLMLFHLSHTFLGFRVPLTGIRKKHGFLILESSDEERNNVLVPKCDSEKDGKTHHFLCQRVDGDNLKNKDHTDSSTSSRKDANKG